MWKYAAALLAGLIATPAMSADWTGFYIGANAGYGWNSSNNTKDAQYYLNGSYGSFANGWFNGENSSKSGSFTIGGQTGYNRQIGNAVIGLEADLNYMNTKSAYSAHDFEDLYVAPNYEYHLREVMSVQSSATWVGTLRPRLGFVPVDRLLVYGTGGLAFGQVKSSANYGWRENGYWWCTPVCGQDGSFDRTGGFSGSQAQTRWGWTLGAGAEYAVTDRVSIKGEYLYVDLGSKRHTFINPQDATELVTSTEATRLHILRIGLNYKL